MFCWRDVRASMTEIPYWWHKICPVLIGWWSNCILFSYIVYKFRQKTRNHTTTKQSLIIFEIYSWLEEAFEFRAGNVSHSLKNSTFYNNRLRETINGKKFKLEIHDYKIYYVNVDLYHQYGISVVEAQVSLLQNAPCGEEQGQRQLYSHATVRDYIPKLDLSPRTGALVKNIKR